MHDVSSKERGPFTSDSTPASGSAPTARKDRYEVLQQLASGGMGVVYRVFDHLAGEERALKRVKLESAGSAGLRALEREYQALSSLDHPRIIRAFDYGSDELGNFYTMELLQGEDLRRVGPMECREACFCLRDVATSLALLHARRLLHRDVSPNNVRRTPDGHSKLLDFGALASFGHRGEIVGTAPCIPPEAWFGAPLDQRADLYSLGALAYWILTKRHAYPARRVEELERIWETDPPPPSAWSPSVPEDLDALVMSLLSRNPLARPASAAEVIARLNVIGNLAPEVEEDAARLAESFLRRPAFIGREREMNILSRAAKGALTEGGGAYRVEGPPGVGRSRLLDEQMLQARMGGACVLEVDASMMRRPYATLRALVLRAFELAPDAARMASRFCRPALAALGRDVEDLLPASSSPPMVGGFELWARHRAMVRRANEIAASGNRS
ncbi:MAG: serine/threonine-protein kinase [Myxococcales bacterium]